MACYRERPQEAEHLIRASINISTGAWRGIAFCVAGGFFWLATRVDVYDATSPYALVHDVFGTNAPAFPHPWWLSAHIWLRKFYSLAAFACVGLTAHKALPLSTKPKLRIALLVALYSTGIEFAQSVFDPSEPATERGLDIACGAVGGWIGVSCLERWLRHRGAFLR